MSKNRASRIKKYVVNQMFSEALKFEEIRNSDVFHTHIAGEDLMDIAICEDLATRLSAGLGKPLVVQLHGTFLPGPESMLIGFERGIDILEKGVLVIASNSNVFEKLCEWGFEKKTIIIPNCVDVKRFTPRPDSPQRKAFDIAFVGRLCEYRDPETAVRAFALLRKKFPQSKLHIVGSGPLESSLRALVSSLSLDESVFLYGAQRNVSDYLRKCDVFWATSPINNYPSSSLLEAFASALPVVATDTGLTRKLVENYQNGLLVDACNPKAIAEATGELFSDEELYARLAVKARQTAERNDCEAGYLELAKFYHRFVC
jgi:glycosyltransferase involved in cell wall biosynthesis